MDKKNNDEKTFGEIFSNINTGNNDDKSISFNSIKEESNFSDSKLKSEDLFKEASHNADNNDSNNMTFNSIFDDDKSSFDDNANVRDSSLEKSSSIFDKAIHDNGESGSSLISNDGDSEKEFVTDNDNSLDIEEVGLDVNPFFNNSSTNDKILEDKSNDGDSSNIFFSSDDKVENKAIDDKVDASVTNDLEENIDAKDSGNESNPFFDDGKVEGTKNEVTDEKVEDESPFFNNNDSTDDKILKDKPNDGDSSNIFFSSDDKVENKAIDDKVDASVTNDLEENIDAKDSGNESNPFFDDGKVEGTKNEVTDEKVEDENPFFNNNDSTDDKILEDESDDGNNIKDNVSGAYVNVVKVSIDDDDNLIEEVPSLDKAVNFNNNINNNGSSDSLFQNADISNLDNNSSEDNNDNDNNDLDVSPFFADTSDSNKKEDVNPFFDNKINLVESTSHDVGDTASKIDTSKVHNFNVKVVKKKEPLIKFILGVLSYAVFIWLLLIGITLLVYVLDIKIRAAKGDTSPPKYNAFVVLSGSMLPEIQVYDVVITKKVDAKSLKEGDVITFASSDTRFLNTIITHRIIKKNYDSKTGGYTFQTQGDNNNVADSALVQPNNIYGKVILKIPKLGYLQEFLASDGGWILVILLPCLIVISYDIVKLSKKLRGKKYKNIKVQSR